MANSVSQSEFARRCGVSRNMINKMVKDGQLVVLPNKKIDITDRINQNYLQFRREKMGDMSQEQESNIEIPDHSPGEKPQQKIKQAPKKKKPAGRVATKTTDDYYQGEIELEGVPENLSKKSKHELDRYKLAVMIQKERINADKARGQLINKDIIFSVFSKLYEIDNTQFLQLSARLTSAICNGIFETEDPEKIVAVTELIDDELYKVQNHIQIEMNKFLESLKLEKINISREDKGE